MKKIITVLVFVGLFASVQAQSYYTQICELMYAEGYSLSTAKYGYLSGGESSYNYKTFSSGLDYMIIAYSENQSVDVDLYLYYTNGTLVFKDTGSDKWAKLSFNTYNTSDTRCKILVKNYKSSSRAKCEVLVFYR